MIPITVCPQTPTRLLGGHQGVTVSVRGEPTDGERTDVYSDVSCSYTTVHMFHGLDLQASCLKEGYFGRELAERVQASEKRATARRAK